MPRSERILPSPEITARIMNRLFPSRRKGGVEKPEAVAAVNDVAESSSSEKETGAADSVTTDTPTPGAEAAQYVEGWKLWSLLVSISSVFILVLLDMSIVATVSNATANDELLT